MRNDLCAVEDATKGDGLRARKNTQLRRKTMKSVGIAIFAMMWLLGLMKPLNAQVLPVGETTTTALVRSEALGPHWTVPNDYQALANLPKVRQLLAFAAKQMGTPVYGFPQDGVRIRYLVRWAKAAPGLYADLWARTYIIPLDGVGKGKYPGATAVLEISYYEATPQLVIPRLLIRQTKDWSPTEYSFDRTNRIVECSATRGQCVFRSALRLLERKNPQVHRSIRATLDSTANKPLGVGLKAVFDPRAFPVGQNELLLASGVFVAALPENEYEAGYVSGTIDDSSDLSPHQNDTSLVKAVKAMIREELKKAARDAAKQLLDYLLNYFGFTWG